MITITVAASAGRGKSTISQIILKALSEAGFSNVDFHDADPSEHTLRDMDKKIEAMAARNIPILVKTQALRRELYNNV